MMDWVTMKEWFKADGWPETALYAYNFDDRSNCSLQANINNANKIKQWVEDILNETGAKKIDLIGHSMGGLSSRYYLKFLGGLDTVDDYVSLGAGHHSVDGLGFGGICGRAGLNSLVKMLNEGDETPGGILDDTLGDRIDPIFGFIYNSTHVPGNISYTSIYSRDDESVPYISSKLDGAQNLEVQGLTHSKLYQNESVYELVKAAVYDPHQLSPPSLIFPIGGETLSGDANISWVASVDTLGYSVTYKISYSTDGGTTWILLKGNLTDTSFIWETSTLSDDSNYILKIEAISSGGLNAIFISVSPFIVVNPTTTITTATTSLGWNVVLLILSLFIILPLKQRKKKS
jgi:triacylglycerol lipase